MGFVEYNQEGDVYKRQNLDYIEKVRKQIFTLENRRPDIYSLSRTKA